MTNGNNELLSSKQVCLIKSRCRKFGFRADQVDDCLQQLALKILQSKNLTALKSEVIDNHIRSQLQKEKRYLAHLLELREDYQEAIIYHLSLRIDMRSLASSMTHLQLEICKLLLDGFTRKQISKKLKISMRRIRQEINVVKQLLNVLAA